MGTKAGQGGGQNGDQPENVKTPEAGGCILVGRFLPAILRHFMNSQLKKILRDYAWPLGVVLLSLVLAALLFKSYLLHPNSHMFAFGGDPFVIYYDMAYHIRYDHSTTFGGMNYPYGEYIFLTDAQGAWGTVLQWIQHHLFAISDYVPGIIHGLNIYLLPLCSLMVFYTLRYYHVRYSLAMPFAVLITFLSPALLRFGNHFGLAYPFVIPMTMLWFLRKYKFPKLEFRDGLVLAILVFFTFNNPYIGFSASSFLCCASLILLLTSFRHRERLKSGLITLSTSLITMLAPFLIFHFNDPVNDRLKQQWGFFYYNANWQGLLYPPNSILYRFLVNFKKQITPIEYESFLNIGIVAIVLLIGIILLLITSIIRRKKWREWSVFSTSNSILIGGAAMMFLYAANHSILEVLKNWMENNLGPLLMFKASARLGWSMYFVITISAIIFLDQLLNKIKRPVFVYGISFLLIGAWACEIRYYVGPYYKDSFHPNFLNRASREEMVKLLADNHIDGSNYQAMLVLPKMMAWNDNFISDIPWSSQFYSQRISAATGLPMISTMLSRTSVGQTAEGIQLLSNPVIHRDLISKLPNRKDILLLVGGPNPSLSIGEQYLVDIAKLAFTSNDFSLYSLSLDSIDQSVPIQRAQHLYKQKPMLAEDIIHLSFDETATDVKFYGQGAKYVYKGQTMLVDRSLQVKKDTQYVFSAWNKLDHHKYGVGEWHVVIQDSLGQVISDLYTETRKSNDIQDLWIRSELTFAAPKGCRIQASVLTEKNIYVDEVLLYPVNAKVIIEHPESAEFLFNGYLVVKPKEGME